MGGLSTPDVTVGKDHKFGPKQQQLTHLPGSEKLISAHGVSTCGTRCLNQKSKSSISTLAMKRNRCGEKRTLLPASPN